MVPRHPTNCSSDIHCLVGKVVNAQGGKKKTIKLTQRYFKLMVEKYVLKTGVSIAKVDPSL